MYLYWPAAVHHQDECWTCQPFERKTEKVRTRCEKNVDEMLTIVNLAAQIDCF